MGTASHQGAPRHGAHRHTTAAQPARRTQYARNTTLLVFIALLGLTLGAVAFSTPRTPAGPAFPGTGADGGGIPFASPPSTFGPAIVGAPTMAAAATPTSVRVADIPPAVATAYIQAANATGASDPSCRLAWTVLAGIGKVESDHARGGALTADGTTVKPILGPVLNGSNNTAAITDTDDGRLDSDKRWDRAVGPMQFIPSTWARWATSTRSGVTPHPQNIHDAASTAARYLCAAGGDLATPEGLRRAILAYNPSQAYLSVVLSWITHYNGTSAPAGTTAAAAALPPASTGATPPPALSKQPSASSSAKPPAKTSARPRATTRPATKKPTPSQSSTTSKPPTRSPSPTSSSPAPTSASPTETSPAPQTSTPSAVSSSTTSTP
ncbi:hypothetical protein [Streptomyces sp. NPDC126514]|uniref:hypothetical protein n=1 Tax=Streptomyces sp. NPDC126514 TaxID=3155210 RepID=UPI003326AC9C